MSGTLETSPFHRGEQAVQERLGVRERAEMIGQRVIRDHLPAQHREFYASLPFVFLGATDRMQRPWASMLVGQPGFMHSPHPRVLDIGAPFVGGDPLAGQLDVSSEVGILGIEYETRRRNRLSARVSAVHDAGLSLAVEQSFGNCPQYIQARRFSLLEGSDTPGQARQSATLEAFDEGARHLIESSDNFYIASNHIEDAAAAGSGADVSHRGGNPGFVQVLDAETLQFPDYAGNRHFNTLGNLVLNPHAGLTFVDFVDGGLLYLTGAVEIIWDGPEVDAIAGAERLLRFTLREGRRVAHAVPIRWDFLDYSPRLQRLA